MKNPRKRNHEITNRGLARKLAEYQAAVLEAHLGVLDCLRNSDIKTQGMIRDLILRIDRALTELHEEHAFVDKLTEKLPLRKVPTEMADDLYPIDPAMEAFAVENGFPVRAKPIC